MPQVQPGDVDSINAALDQLRDAATPAEKDAARNAVKTLGAVTARALPPQANVRAFCDRLDVAIDQAYAS